MQRGQLAVLVVGATLVTLMSSSVVSRPSEPGRAIVVIKETLRVEGTERHNAHAGAAVEAGICTADGTGRADCVTPHWHPRQAIPVCARAFGRPRWASAELLEASVRQAAERWNATHAAVGVEFTGECADSDAGWESRNGVNEVGWDTAQLLHRDEVGGALLVAEVPAGHTDWQIVEADVVLSGRRPLSRRCLTAVVTHEIGHALGLGHSSDRADVMFDEFSVRRPADCRTAPSVTDAERLRLAYGEDDAPVLTHVTEAVLARLGAEVVLHAAATDPEGREVAFHWRQQSGPRVTSGVTGLSCDLLCRPLQRHWCSNWLSWTHTCTSRSRRSPFTSATRRHRRRSDADPVCLSWTGGRQEARSRW